MNKNDPNENFPILLAEDEGVARKVLENVLLKAGYEVVSVQNGLEAWELLNERFFPVVLTDWVMPEMNGLELCRRIRQSNFPGYVFIILLTAKDAKSDIIDGLEAGADDYLTKPVHNAELVARLRTAKRICDLEKAFMLMTITDPLTGAFNRGHMAECVNYEIGRAARYAHPTSLILCDIDYFKQINDTYGHQAGDEVLKAFVKCLQDTIRHDVDLLFRYGGEEFALLLPETNLTGALHLGERIRCLVSQLETQHDRKRIQITASIGVSCYDPTATNKDMTNEALVNMADQYLYKCKRGGRNKVLGGLVPSENRL